ncbi:MAG: DUF4405 domain-containing protein [Pseudodesulfovibrio sp.]
MSNQTFRMRALFSVLALLSLIVLFLTGVVEFIAPHHHTAGGISGMGTAQDMFSDIHAVFGLLFLICSSIHIAFNYKQLLNYLRRSATGKPFSSEVAVAGFLSLILLIGSLVGLS